VNMKYTEVLGFTREEFLNQDFNFIELVTEESREGITASLAEHCKGNEVKPTEYVLFTKTGKPIQVILDQAGQVGGKITILGVVTDISEYKLENILTRSEEKIPQAP